MIYSSFCAISLTPWHSLKTVFPCTPSGTVAENVVKAAWLEGT